MKFKKFISEENLLGEVGPRDAAYSFVCVELLAGIFENLGPSSWFKLVEVDPYTSLDPRVRRMQELVLEAIIALMGEGVIVEVGGNLLLSPSRQNIQMAMDIAGMWYVGNGFEVPVGRKAFTLTEKAEQAIDEVGLEEFCMKFAQDLVTEKEFGVAPTLGEKGN